MSATRPEPGRLERLAAWIAESARLPFDDRWHRVSRPGWQRRLYWVAAGGLAVVALLTVWKSFDWRLSEPSVQLFLLIWWSGLLVAGAVTGRALSLGLWAGRRGIRIEWLVHREIVPWSQVHALWVVPAPLSFGGRIERLVVERTDGRRITVHGTDSYLHTFFGADSPDSVRHTLEAERRFYAGADLPRRRAGLQGTIQPSRPIVDLRSGDAAAARSRAGSVT